MIDTSLPVFIFPEEVWDDKKCAKMANRVAKDALGTKYPFKGYIGVSYCTTYYNGGIVIDGKWWQGVTRNLPRLAEGFKIVSVPSWGMRIVKT